MTDRAYEVAALDAVHAEAVAAKLVEVIVQDAERQKWADRRYITLLQTRHEVRTLLREARAERDAARAEVERLMGAGRVTLRPHPPLTIATVRPDDDGGNSFELRAT